MACSLALFPGYTKGDSDNLTPVSWFASDTGEYLFNTGIDVMKKHFSGLMVIKPTGRDTCRVIMITEVGLKVMDLELFPTGGLKVHYIMEPLNKKILIRTLSNDIGMVLMNRLSHKNYEVLQDRKKGDAIFRYRFGRQKNFYYLSDNSPYPYYVRQVKGITNKVHASFYGNGSWGPDSVNIEHYNLALSVKLHRIKETSHVDE
jgi:hypothetical protein